MIETRTWTGRNGQTRHYVQNLADLLGLDVDYYKSGNIRTATRNGAEISNAEANRILAARVWLDDEGAVHIDGLAARTVTEQDIRDAVAAAQAPAEVEVEVVKQATITAQDAVETLVREGHDLARVVAVLDSLIDSGLTVDSDGPAVFTADELDVARDELATRYETDPA